MVQRLHPRNFYIGTTAERGALNLPSDGIGATFWDTEEEKIYIWNDAWVGGAGTITTVKEDGVQVGDADIVTLDFLGADFNISETPDTEINITIEDSGIDHNAVTNTHNLTSDIDHDQITNTHNLTTDIDHDQITNTHNLTTDIDHDALTNFTTDEHFTMLDEDDLVSDDDTQAATQQSIKAYIDSIGAGLWTRAGTDTYLANAGDNVGIGGTPGVKLDIIDSIPVIRLTDTRNLSDPDWDEEILGDIDFYTSDISGGGVGVVSRIRAVVSVDSVNDPRVDMAFWTGRTSAFAERIRIDWEGNVGIGTDSPSVKLHIVDGEVYLINSGNNPRIVIGDSTGAGNWGSIGWNSAGDRIEIGTDTGGTDTLVINESGNVGISTTTPLSTLEVGDGNYTLASAATSGASLTVVGVGGKAVGRIYIEGSSQADILFDDSGGVANQQLLQLALFAEKFRLRGLTDVGGISHNFLVGDLSTGNVGIGFTSMDAKLAIDGGLHVGGDSDPGDDNLIVDGVSTVTGRTTLNGSATFGNTQIYLVSGVLDATNLSGFVRVWGEGGVHDTLTTISNGYPGQILMLSARASAADITIVTGGNIKLNGGTSFKLDRGLDIIMFVYDSGNSVWLEIGRGAG